MGRVPAWQDPSPEASAMCWVVIARSCRFLLQTCSAQPQQLKALTSTLSNTHGTYQENTRALCVPKQTVLELCAAFMVTVPGYGDCCVDLLSVTPVAA
jgi:hypothetical protein